MTLVRIKLRGLGGVGIKVKEQLFWIANLKKILKTIAHLVNKLFPIISSYSIEIELSC